MLSVLANEKIYESLFSAWIPPLTTKTSIFPAWCKSDSNYLRLGKASWSIVKSSWSFK